MLRIREGLRLPEVEGRHLGSYARLREPHQVAVTVIKLQRGYKTGPNAAMHHVAVGAGVVVGIHRTNGRQDEVEEGM